MNDDATQLLLDQVRAIRQLLELLAEPAIAQRDARLRSELRRIVGSSEKKQRAVLLMDGTRTQAQLVAQTTVNQGHLSSMVGQLEGAGLLADGRKQPELAILIPANFFDADTETN